MQRHKNALVRGSCDGRPGLFPLFPALTLLTLAPALCFVPTKRAAAEGFRNPPPGSFGLARSGGRFAHVDDATSITHNPANLVNLLRPELEAGATLVHIAVDYESPAGERAGSIDPWKYLPTLYYGQPMDDGRWAFGLGVTAPYGLSNEWERDTVLRYSAPYFTELKSINVNPTLAWRFSENLSVGGGVDVMWSELTLNQFYPWGLVSAGAPDGRVKAEGDGGGVGANLGVTWEPVPGHRLAMTMRTPIKVNYSGDFVVTDAPAGYADPTRSSFGSEIEFPLIIGAGYGVEVTDRLRLEANVEWIEFSRFDRLPLRANALPPGVPASVDQDWRDTFTFGLGGDWQVTDQWSVRGSYQHYMTPVPDWTYSPTIPDANQNVVTIGAEFREDDLRFAASYGLVLYEDRDITNNQNPTLNGEYSMRVHLFAVSATFEF